MNKEVDNKRELTELAIMLIYCLLGYGFDKDGYRMNIFPSNKKLAQDINEFCQKHRLSQGSKISENIEINEYDIARLKPFLKQKGIISYYLNEDLKRNVMKLSHASIGWYGGEIIDRMKHWRLDFLEKDADSFNQDLDICEYYFGDQSTIH